MESRKDYKNIAEISHDEIYDTINTIKRFFSDLDNETAILKILELFGINLDFLFNNYKLTPDERNYFVLVLSLHLSMQFHRSNNDEFTCYMDFIKTVLNELKISDDKNINYSESLLKSFKKILSNNKGDLRTYLQLTGINRSGTNRNSPIHDCPTDLSRTEVTNQFNSQMKLPKYSYAFQKFSLIMSLTGSPHDPVKKKLHAQLMKAFKDEIRNLSNDYSFFVSNDDTWKQTQKIYKELLKWINSSKAKACSPKIEDYPYLHLLIQLIYDYVFKYSPGYKYNSSYLKQRLEEDKKASIFPSQYRISAYIELNELFHGYSMQSRNFNNSVWNCLYNEINAYMLYYLELCNNKMKQAIIDTFLFSSFIMGISQNIDYWKIDFPNNQCWINSYNGLNFIDIVSLDILNYNNVLGLSTPDYYYYLILFMKDLSAKSGIVDSECFDFKIINKIKDVNDQKTMLQYITFSYYNYFFSYHDNHVPNFIYNKKMSYITNEFSCKGFRISINKNSAPKYTVQESFHSKIEEMKQKLRIELCKILFPDYVIGGLNHPSKPFESKDKIKLTFEEISIKAQNLFSKRIEIKAQLEEAYYTHPTTFFAHFLLIRYSKSKA